MLTRRPSPVWKLVALWVAALAVIIFAVVDVMPEHKATIAKDPVASPTTPGATSSLNSAAQARRSAARARASASAAAASAAQQSGDALLASLNSATLSSDTALASVGAMDVQTGQVVTWQSPGFGADTPAYMASTAKVYIAEGFLLQKQDAQETLTDQEMQLLTTMITNSDNDSADALYDAVGEDAWPDMLKRLGLTSTQLDPEAQWGLTETTVADQLQVLTNLRASNSPLDENSRNLLLGLMSQIESDQDWGVSAAGTDAELKNGWLPLSDGGWVINSMGFVTGANGHQYQMVIITNGWDTEAEGISAVEDLAHNLAQSLGG